MPTAFITFMGQKVQVACDGLCHKAWGINNRPRIKLSETNEDDYVYKSDGELAQAPIDPGTYECGQAKPLLNTEFPTKWCVRECERCSMSSLEGVLELEDFSKRVYNIPRLHPDAS